MTPKVYCNLRYNVSNNKIILLGLTGEKILPETDFDISLFLPDMIHDDNLIINWLKELNISEENINIVLESLTTLGMEAGHLMNQLTLRRN